MAGDEGGGINPSLGTTGSSQSTVSLLPQGYSALLPRDK